jgi:hypothetical protein
MKSLAFRMLRLYPPAWRARYGEELAALLEMSVCSPFVLLDVLRGAFDAHLHPELVAEKGPYHMPTRLRASEIAVFAAFILFVVAGIGFQKSGEDIMKVDASNAAINIPYLLVEGGAVVALLAVLAGGLPIAFAALRDALAHRRRGILALFCVPIVSFAALVVYSFVALQVRPVSDGLQLASQVGQDTGHHLFIGLIALFLLGAVASTWAVAAAIRRAEVSAGLFRFALLPAAVATLAMALMLAAVVAWGLALRAADPAAFNGHDGILATSTLLTWIGHIVLMGVATLVAAVALLRALRSGAGTPTARAA